MLANNLYSYFLFSTDIILADISHYVKIEIARKKPGIPGIPEIVKSAEPAACEGLGGAG